MTVPAAAPSAPSGPTTGYSFKSIQTVPTLNEFLDIVLSRTQRKTPTVVHKGYAISRIRSFYIRKVRFTQQTFDEKLGAILSEFPRVDDVHPFYADLMNILYDKDHYKLALAQINTARHLIDGVGKEYQKLLKFGDSLYRCKQLKRAALGRMATIMKRQKETLVYLEQVRQHLSRLPCIDPHGRTLLLCGYPNVGKSSFMNKLTRAHVDVQPYAFTTKSLFVGHHDYRYLRWQVIDTPGILDHPLEERNTIEMQSITALAHLRACVLYFIDPSGQCGYSLAQQVALFHSIRPLFANKPLLVICNKADLLRPEQISGEDAQLMASLAACAEIVASSSVTEEGVMDVRTKACEKLLAQRVEAKIRTGRANDIVSRLNLALPAPRDQNTRPAFIPEAVQARRQQQAEEMEERRLARDLEAEAGGAGVYLVDLKQHRLLKDPEWQYDEIPELMNGRNVADFIDPEIDARLQALEEEEARLEAEGFYDEERFEATPEERAWLASARQLEDEKAMAREIHRAKKRCSSRPVITARMVRKRTASRDDDDHEVDHDMDIEPAKKSKMTMMPEKRDRSTVGLRDASQLRQAQQHQRASQKMANLHARAGEADRHITASKPKHLFSGKRKSGTNDRR